MDQPARRPTFRQVILGLFVTGQLLFILLANYLFFVPQRDPTPEERVRYPDGLPTSGIRLALGKWEQVTGQTQYWALFHAIGKEARFAAVRLDDGRTLPSVFDPEDTEHYFRPPGGSDRLYHFEANLLLLDARWDQPGREADAELFHNTKVKWLRRNWRAVQAWCEWQIRRSKAQPGLEVILLSRFYKNPGENGNRPAPEEHPLVRWRPGQAAPDCLPLELYDPSRHAFVPVKEAD